MLCLRLGYFAQRSSEIEWPRISSAPITEVNLLYFTTDTSALVIGSCSQPLLSHCFFLHNFQRHLPLESSWNRFKKIVIRGTLEMADGSSRIQSSTWSWCSVEFPCSLGFSVLRKWFSMLISVANFLTSHRFVRRGLVVIVLYKTLSSTTSGRQSLFISVALIATSEAFKLSPAMACMKHMFPKCLSEMLCNCYCIPFLSSHNMQTQIL